ncbi:MAG: DUF2975 domain-containing protein [Spirosomataceae bacterium]
MKTTTKQIFAIMHVISWVVFVGLCIKAGAILISYSVSMFVNEAGAKDLYMGLDLHSLYDSSKGYYTAVVSLIIVLLCLKAYVFYLLILIFRKLNLVHPFSREVVTLISKISYVILSAGVLAMLAEGYNKWLFHRGIGSMYEWGSSELLFMGGIVFTIALIFQRGVEIQSENELTI